MINFTTPKGLGYPVANAVRHFILSNSVTARIVGFSLGNQTILSSGNIDLVSFSAELAGLDIELDELESYPTLTRSIECNGVLTVGDLQKNGINVLNHPSDYILLDTMGSVTISFILNKCSSIMSGIDNKNLLSTSGLNVKGYNIISSRALDLKVAFKVKKNLNNDEVSFEVSSVDEEKILRESVNNALQVFGGILA